MGTQAITEAKSVPQHWNDEELDRLRELAPQIVTKSTIAELFPDRTTQAVKGKLAEIRKELGVARPSYRHTTDIEPTMLDPDDEGVVWISWQEQKRPAWESANARFLAALQMAAA